MTIEHNYIINQLVKNQSIFKELLFGITKEQYTWRKSVKKWSLLDIVYHLYDEECNDFRARVKHVLETPDLPLKPIDPEGWVKLRNYADQEYDKKVKEFLEEREESIVWLRSLENVKWNNEITHPEYGKMTANQFLANWLAHDYLHTRQILQVKFDYLKHVSKEQLDYAGGW